MKGAVGVCGPILNGGARQKTIRFAEKKGFWGRARDYPHCIGDWRDNIGRIEDT